MRHKHIILLWLVLFLFLAIPQLFSQSNRISLLQDGRFYSDGWELLTFHNWYDGSFSDSKISGIELIHHGVRTVTNGDVRLQSTPGQWDATPNLKRRIVDTVHATVTIELEYPQYDFSYAIQVTTKSDSVVLRIVSEKEVPQALVGKAGLNLEFLPSAYFEKSFILGSFQSYFPLSPISNHQKVSKDSFDLQPFARGFSFIASPEDEKTRIEVKSSRNELLLYDGRVQAQNGWFVLRSLLPAHTRGILVEWILKPYGVPGWQREPVLLYSQVGYHPNQAKRLLIESDSKDSLITPVRLLKIVPEGKVLPVLTATPVLWGKYLRYKYWTVDFSSVSEEGNYVFEFRGKRTSPFRIVRNVYADIWHPTMDVFLPVQMDHMRVRQAYRIWHGVAHMDDALQAPTNHVHFDLYAQGPTTDSDYQPYEHIPGLNIGGWFDAGDFDIRTQTHYAVVQTLSHVWEEFQPRRDETYVNQATRYCEIHRPDGRPDMLQQIEHGVLALVAQFRVFGHAICGIIDNDLRRYTHLGDAASQTDNQICTLPSHQKNEIGEEGRRCDDRWAFTTETSALNYGSIAALAAAHRALKGYNDTLAAECLQIAEATWQREQNRPPRLFRFGNTTGGDLQHEKLKAATELFLSTKNKLYLQSAKELLAQGDTNALSFLSMARYLYDYLDNDGKKIVRRLAEQTLTMMERVERHNPFGVPITTTGWAGNGAIVAFATTAYHMHKMFPDMVPKEKVFAGLHYLFGTHPGSNISYVSSVGTISKKIAYGNNRADFSFIAGGVVPGNLILKPDFPENKEDWPFFWGENEYVINLAASYVYLALAADTLFMHP